MQWSAVGCAQICSGQERGVFRHVVVSGGMGLDMQWSSVGCVQICSGQRRAVLRYVVVSGRLCLDMYQLVVGSSSDQQWVVVGIGRVLSAAVVSASSSGNDWQWQSTVMVVSSSMSLAMASSRRTVVKAQWSQLDGNNNEWSVDNSSDDRAEYVSAIL